MAKKDLKKIAAQAAEIVKDVPENLQEAAFKWALEELVQEEGGKATKKKKGGLKDKKQAAPTPKSSNDSYESLLNKIDSTKYPNILRADKAGERAMLVLQLAFLDHEVDNLSPPQIADILTKKFRIRTKANAINMALSRAADKVDVITIDGKKHFRIMEPGLRFLDEIKAGSGENGAKPKKPKRKPAKKPKEVAAESPGKKAKKPKPRKAKANKKKATGCPGPKAAINMLLEGGFFDSPQTPSQTKDELQHNRGYNYPKETLSLALLRMVRDQFLKRERNEDGQYEYTKA